MIITIIIVIIIIIIIIIIITIRWECAIGTFMPTTGDFTANFATDTGCPYACAAGFYANSPLHEDNSCAGPCPAGFFCEEGTASPSPCPQGTRQPELGARTVGACIPCSLIISITIPRFSRL